MLSLLPDMMAAGWQRAVAPLRIALRRSWPYRQLLGGPLTDHLAFHPWDGQQRRLEDAEALLRGRFRFHGDVVDVLHGTSVFDLVPPSQAWAEALHGWDWLPPLAAAGGEPARMLATNLIAQWIARNGRYSEPVWSAHVLARRLAHMFAHGKLVVSNSDMLWRSKLFVSLREQARMLERIAGEAPEGLPRFEAAAVLALSGLCLEENPARLAAGLACLEREAQRQILPDGGHVSRNPATLLHLLLDLVPLRSAIIAARGLSSAASAANAAIDHIRDWVLGSNGKWVTMGVPSDGSYGIPEGIIYGVPVTTANGEYTRVAGLEIDAFSRERMDFTLNELLEERDGIAELLK